PVAGGAALIAVVMAIGGPQFRRREAVGSTAKLRSATVVSSEGLARRMHVRWMTGRQRRQCVDHPHTPRVATTRNYSPSPRTVLILPASSNSVRSPNLPGAVRRN